MILTLTRAPYKGMINVDKFPEKNLHAVQILIRLS